MFIGQNPRSRHAHGSPWAWHPNRSAFTLIELLVVIAIIGVLVALTLSAVQMARAAAARAKCANNLHQLGIALTQYHDEQGGLPPGVRGFARGEPYPYASWLTRLLPYVEQDNLWRTTVSAYAQSRRPFTNPPHVGLATPIPLFVCPSDYRVQRTRLAPKDGFQVAFTSYLGIEGQDAKKRDGVLYMNSAIRFADIEDGTSNTLLAGERPPSADFQFGWWYAGVGQVFTGSAEMVLGVREQNLMPIRKGSCPPGTYWFEPGSLDNQCDMFHFWSPHPGGAHFLFCDGSVHFMSYSANAVLPALASRAGGEAAAAE